MAGLNISLNISFSPSAIVLLCCRRSTVFFIDSERNETVSLNFPAGFSLLFSRKTSLRMSRWMSAKRRCKVQAPMKGGNFGAKLSLAYHWKYHFSHTWKNVVRDFYGTYHFFNVGKSSFARLIGYNSFAFETLQHSISVSITHYVYNKGLYWLMILPFVDLNWLFATSLQL